MPPTFLVVAAFLLYIVISRMVQSERSQIGLMKAFAYTKFEVGMQYLKLVLAIAIGGAINGLPEAPRLNRAIDAGLAPIPLAKEGVTLSTPLADILHVRAGDTLTVDVREGRQPVLRLPVTCIATSLLGAPAYMDVGALNRDLCEPNRVSGAYLSINSDRAEIIYQTLQDMPNVPGVGLKSDARGAFQTMMNQSAGAIRYVMGAVAFIITIGIVCHSRDATDLRVNARIQKGDDSLGNAFLDAPEHHVLIVRPHFVEADCTALPAATLLRSARRDDQRGPGHEENLAVD